VPFHWGRTIVKKGGQNVTPHAEGSAAKASKDEEVSEIKRLKNVLIELRLESPRFEQILGNVLAVFMFLRPRLQWN
jgi:hypothetical protein